MAVTAATSVGALEVPGVRARWGAAHYFACFGGLMLAMQAWTYGAWLAAGPYSITQWKTPGSVNWWAARGYEVTFGFLFFCLLAWVVRRCLRERRFTFDAKLMLAGYSVIWLDAWVNIFAPVWMYSSNWVNLNNPLAGFPLPVNPDIGRLPFPLLFHLFCYPLTNLGAALLVCALMERIRARWPAISIARMLLLVTLVGLLFDLAFEIPMFKLRLWAYPGSPDQLALFSGDSTKYPIWEMVPAALCFGSFGALRFFKDDKGREITERGLEAHAPRMRTLISTVALVGVVNGVWLVFTTLQATVGLYAAPYKPLPAYLVNDLCDAPLLEGGRVTGTRYGPCPEKGYAMPVRALPGPAPGSPYASH